MFENCGNSFSIIYFTARVCYNVEQNQKKVLKFYIITKSEVLRFCGCTASGIVLLYLLISSRDNTFYAVSLTQWHFAVSLSLARWYGLWFTEHHHQQQQHRDSNILWGNGRCWKTYGSLNLIRRQSKPRLWDYENRLHERSSSLYNIGMRQNERRRFYSRRACASEWNRIFRFWEGNPTFHQLWIEQYFCVFFLLTIFASVALDVVFGFIIWPQFDWCVHCTVCTMWWWRCYLDLNTK